MKREPKASRNKVMDAARLLEDSHLVIKTWKSDDEHCFGIWRQTPGQSDRKLGLLPTDLPIVVRCLSVIEFQFSYLDCLDQALRGESGCQSHSLAATLGFNPEVFIPATVWKVKV